MTGEKADLSFRIPAETFDFRINKKLTFFVFKHDLKD